MKNRLFENRITSIAGLIVLLAGIAFYYVGKIDWEAFLALIPLSLVLLRAKDTLLGINPKKPKL